MSDIGRFGLESAPGGLRLVQSLVNTSLSGQEGEPERDHLADATTADAWLRAALADWSSATGRAEPTLSLRRADLAPLRQLRARLRESLRANAAHVERDEPQAATLPDFDVRLTLNPDGTVGHRPLGTGWQGVAGLVATELLLAGATGTLTRLKTCAAPHCGACFYDASPNRSRAWHDTKVCGNVPNLRASRARRKAATLP
jgi:predicted RNA-binding Zn ribbon-like protein